MLFPAPFPMVLDGHFHCFFRTINTGWNDGGSTRIPAPPPVPFSPSPFQHPYHGGGIEERFTRSGLEWNPPDRRLLCFFRCFACVVALRTQPVGPVTQSMFLQTMGIAHRIEALMEANDDEEVHTRSVTVARRHAWVRLCPCLVAFRVT